jgi:hypothetical protein
MSVLRGIRWGMCSDFPPGNPIAARRLTITPNAGPFPLRTRSSCSTPRLRRRMQMSRRQQTRTTRRPQPTPSTPACLRSMLRLTTEIPTGPHHHGLADRIARAADGAHSGRPCGASSILPRDNGRAQRKYGYGRLTNLQCLLDFCRTYGVGLSLADLGLPSFISGTDGAGPSLGVDQHEPNSAGFVMPQSTFHSSNLAPVFHHH